MKKIEKNQSKIKTKLNEIIATKRKNKAEFRIIKLSDYCSARANKMKKKSLAERQKKNVSTDILPSASTC